MNSVYLRNGSTFQVSSRQSLDLHDALPGSNFSIGIDGSGNFYLSQIESFTMPERIYGKIPQQTQRILRSFQERPGSTGVMLTGEKGSGKTLLAKNISVEAARQGVPTLVINSSLQGDKFNAFLQSISQPCIVLFDEFEKVYDRDDQERILTLLDGVYPSRKLFLLTCNDKWRVDQHMRNRPGRIFYMLDFAGVDQNFIREYCQENLDGKEYIDRICKISSLFDQFNFDMLKALVEEMNRFGESPEASLEMLNIKPEFSQKRSFEVVLTVNGRQIDRDDLEDKVWDGNPLTGINMGYCIRDEEKDTMDWESEEFTPEDLKQVDGTRGKFVFANKKGSVISLTRVAESRFNYDTMAF